MPAAVIAHRGLDAFRQEKNPAGQFLEGLLLQGGLGLQGGVQAIHVSLVVFAVVDVHRQGINVGQQGVLGIGQGSQGKGTGGSRRSRLGLGGHGGGQRGSGGEGDEVASGRMGSHEM